MYVEGSRHSASREVVFEGISLAANNVDVDKLAANIYEQLTTAVKEFHKYFIAIDKGTCRSETAFCAAFIRGVDEQAYMAEEPLDLISMKGTVTGRDSFLELKKCVDPAGLDWSKLVLIATNGASAMYSEKVELIGLLKKKLYDSM